MKYVKFIIKQKKQKKLKKCNTAFEAKNIKAKYKFRIFGESDSSDEELYQGNLFTNLYI